VQEVCDLSITTINLEICLSIRFVICTNIVLIS
jgi:hypothetical protein